MVRALQTAVLGYYQSLSAATLPWLLPLGAAFGERGSSCCSCLLGYLFVLLSVSGPVLL